MPATCFWIGLALLPLVLWAARRLLIAAIASRCPACGSKFHAVPVSGDRRYERWHCSACDRYWDERYDDRNPNGSGGSKPDPGRDPGEVRRDEPPARGRWAG